MKPEAQYFEPQVVDEAWVLVDGELKQITEEEEDDDDSEEGQ